MTIACPPPFVRLLCILILAFLAGFASSSEASRIGWATVGLGDVEAIAAPPPEPAAGPVETAGGDGDHPVLHDLDTQGIAADRSEPHRLFDRHRERGATVDRRLTRGPPPLA